MLIALAQRAGRAIDHTISMARRPAARVRPVRLAMLVATAFFAMATVASSARAQTNPSGTSLASGAVSNAPGEPIQEVPSRTVKPAAQQSHRHKKKSFMQKMRDKATQQVQKVLSAKHQNSKTE
jgi:hypothetical protein